MIQILKRIIFNPIFGYSLIAILLGASLVYGASGANYRAQLLADREDTIQSENQSKRIFDSTGRLITEKRIDEQKLTQEMIRIDNKIKVIRAEIDSLLLTQKNATDIASDQRLKRAITEKHLRDYDEAMGFHQEAASQ